jgi:hypothetical protein
LKSATFTVSELKILSLMPAIGISLTDIEIGGNQPMRIMKILVGAGRNASGSANVDARVEERV